MVVKGKKERYRNKDNPAMVLIRKVIEHKSENRKEAFDYFRYNKYEKLEFAFFQFIESRRNNPNEQRNRE